MGAVTQSLGLAYNPTEQVEGAKVRTEEAGGTYVTDTPCPNSSDISFPDLSDQERQGYEHVDVPAHLKRCVGALPERYLHNIMTSLSAYSSYMPTDMSVSPIWHHCRHDELVRVNLNNAKPLRGPR